MQMCRESSIQYNPKEVPSRSANLSAEREVSSPREKTKMILNIIISVEMHKLYQDIFNRRYLFESIWYGGRIQRDYKDICTFKGFPGKLD